MTEIAKQEFFPDRAKFKDATGKFLTQSLFLENGYNTEYAIYTLTDEDKEYKGKVYPSLRRLYLETMDPTEYEFSRRYLWGWDHWQRIAANNLMTEQIELWREELEVRLRSMAVRSIVIGALGSYNSAKWIADGSWKQKRGRPSKAELAKEKRIREKAANAATEDSDRIVDFIARKEKDNG